MTDRTTPGGDPRLEVLDALIANLKATRAALASGTRDLSAFEPPRETLLDKLRTLDASHPGPLPEVVRARLERITRLNEELISAIGAAVGDTGAQLRATTGGRRGLAGYLAAASAGQAKGAKLGRG